MFSEMKSRETSGLERNRTNWFPEGNDIECFVIFLDFYFSVLQEQQICLSVK